MAATDLQHPARRHPRVTVRPGDSTASRGQAPRDEGSTSPGDRALRTLAGHSRSLARRRGVRRLTLVLALASALALAILTPANAQVAGIAGEIPAGGGVAAVVWAGGSVDALAAEARAAGCDLRSISMFVGGAAVTHIPGAPPFVNAPFVASYPAGVLPADSIAFLRCEPAGLGAPAPGGPAGPAAALPDRPAGWPATFGVGVADAPGGAAARAAEGHTFRYQYLAGGVNTGEGWATWNAGGTFVTRYIEESIAQGVHPVFSYYMLRQSTPGRGLSEPDAALTNTRDAATMAAFYEDLRLFFERAGAFDELVVLHLEPDLWGYLQHRSMDNDASSTPVAVASTGIAALAGLPDTLAGFARGIVRLRDAHAPNVLLAYSISTWGTRHDILLEDPPMSEIDELSIRAAAWYRSLGARFDLAFAEFSDRDAGYKQHIDGDGGAGWWTPEDDARFSRFLGGFVRATGQRVVLWQIPIGNTRMRAMDNTWHHFQDNRVERLLGEAGRTTLDGYVDAGVIALLFGHAIAGTTCACDQANDGLTNPPAINGNTRASLTAHDDGGYFVEQVGGFARDVPIPLP